MPRGRAGESEGLDGHGVKVKNPNAPAVTREAEEDWGNKRSSNGVPMGEFYLDKLVDELFKPTHPPKEAALKNTDETPSPISLLSILPRLPPEGQAWLNGLNPFCRWAVEYDLRTETDSFVEHWEYLRDTLQKLERDFGPSDSWK